MIWVLYAMVPLGLLLWFLFASDLLWVTYGLMALIGGWAMWAWLSTRRKLSELRAENASVKGAEDATHGQGAISAIHQENHEDAVALLELNHAPTPGGEA